MMAGINGWIVFIAGTAALLSFSGKFMRSPSSHGFWRLFAFESILALIIITAGPWFRDPFSPRQAVSWILLALSAWLALAGWRALAARGRPRGNFEKTTRLVAHGIYKRIRHPMYASLICFAWGAFLKDLSPASASLAAAATFFAVKTAKVEEKENRAKFGRRYLEYIRRTRMFLPFFF